MPSSPLPSSSAGLNPTARGHRRSAVGCIGVGSSRGPHRRKVVPLMPFPLPGPLLRRAGIPLAAVVAALVGLSPQPALADPPPASPAQIAAGWLAGQLVDGERF